MLCYPRYILVHCATFYFLTVLMSNDRKVFGVVSIFRNKQKSARKLKQCEKKSLTINYNRRHESDNAYLTSFGY